VLEFEQETMFTERASLPFRIDVGFFHHPRYQTGLFVDVNYGFRQYFKSGLFLEESIGLGLLEGILSSDGVYEVDDNGNVTDATILNKLDLMPSLTLGIGYDLSSSKNKKNLIWIRPQAYYQYPFRTTSAYNFALQVGYTHTIN